MKKTLESFIALLFHQNLALLSLLKELLSLKAIYRPQNDKTFNTL